MALGESGDHGIHFTSLPQFNGIYGGLGCAGTSIEPTCTAAWAGLQQEFEIDAGPPPKPIDEGVPGTSPPGVRSNLLGSLVLRAVSGVIQNGCSVLDAWRFAPTQLGVIQGAGNGQDPGVEAGR